MSEIEELWVGSTNNETLKRVNNAIKDDIVYCECCGKKIVIDSRGNCGPCPECGYKKL